MPIASFFYFIEKNRFRALLGYNFSWDRVLLCTSVRPGTDDVTFTVLKAVTVLPQHPQDYRHVPSQPVRLSLDCISLLDTATLQITCLNFFLGLITRGSMEVKANDFYSPCQHFNVTVALLVDPMKEYNTTCTPEYHPGKSTTVEEEPSRENSLNHTCGIVGNMSNCTHVFLHLAMDVKCKFEMKWEEKGEVGYTHLKLRKGCEIHQKSNGWRISLLK